MTQRRLVCLLPARLGTALVTVALLVTACAPMPEAFPSSSTAQPGVVQSAADTAAELATELPAMDATWKVFSDAAAGYSLGYPPDVASFTSGWSKAGVHTTRIQFRVPGVEGYQGMLVRVEPNKSGSDVEEIVSALYRRFVDEEVAAGPIVGLEDVSIDGLPGIQMGGSADFAIVVPYEDKVYIFAPVHDEAMTALDPQALALFYRVLATLKVQR